MIIRVKWIKDYSHAVCSFIDNHRFGMSDSLEVVRVQEAVDRDSITLGITNCSVVASDKASFSWQLTGDIDQLNMILKV